MIRKRLLVIAPLLVLCFSSVAVTQSSLANLRTWAGKYPTEKKGRITRKFFSEPQVRTPLLRLLSRTDFNLLTSAYAVEAPIKEMGHYLSAKNCRPHNCGDEQASFAIDLRTGDVFVRMQLAEKVRWFASKGDASSLPKEVLDYMNDFGEQ